MPDRFGVPVVTTLVYFLHLYTRLRVRPAPGIPCALFFEGHDDAGPGHNSCRGMRCAGWLFDIQITEPSAIARVHPLNP